MNTETDQKKALVLLIRGIMLAQKRGAYELVEAETLSKAIRCFTTNDNEKNELLKEDKAQKIETNDDNSFII